MKQLKFMLAAATAIGLATAAQAAEKVTPLVTDGFNDATWDGLNPVEIKVKPDGANVEYKIGYFFHPSDDANAADNESKVEDGALKVNTGTDPLLRALSYSKTTDSANNVDLTAVSTLNIDTMVQFTVTPSVDKDNVTATASDKLMIYLLEVPEVKEGDEIVSAATTKLMVKAAKCVDGEWVEGGEDYEIQLPDGLEVVSPNEWYRLVVKAKAYVNGVDEETGSATSWWPVFQVYLASATDTNIDVDDLCKMVDVDGAGYDAIDSGEDEAGSFFVSLAVSAADGEEADSAALALQYVGFAGEGVVDDLAVSTVEEVNSLDFTFTWSGDGIKEVTYTIGEDTYEVTSGTAFQVQPGASFTVNVALVDEWYKLAQTSYVYNNVTEGDEVEIPSAEKIITTEPAADGTVTVNPSATTEEIAGVKESAGITGGAFKDVTDTTELGKVLTWQSKNNVSGDNVSAVEFETAAVTNVDGSVESVLVAKGPAAEAYLLNCDPASTVEGQTLQDAKDNFKFEAKDLADLFDLTKETANLQNSIFSTKGYNGSIVLEGKEELSGEWKIRASGHKFFRARLVK